MWPPCPPPETRAGVSATCGSRLIPALLVALASFGAPLAAQSNPIEIVVHLWVDPKFGSDEIAAGDLSASIIALNPQPTNSVGTVCSPAPNRPNDARSVSLSGSVLLHAPYPFLTITGAVDYIRATQSGAPLPYTSSTTPTVVWSSAVIHLLPGIYGPVQGGVVESGSRLPRNGETLPIVLPPRVSLQGTSALNTILDAGEIDEATGLALGPILEFGTEANSGDLSYVDSVTITGVVGVDKNADNSSPTSVRQTSAVHIAPDYSANPQFSNCFFVRNSVAVAVVAADTAGLTPVPQHDGTSFVNNTFARNAISIWNGQDVDPTTEVAVGVSELTLLNNAFDATFRESTSLWDARCIDLVPGSSNFDNDPATNLPQFETGRSNSTGFEGIDIADVLADDGTGTFLNFNAFDFDRVNRYVSPVGVAATRTPFPGVPGTTARVAPVLNGSGGTMALDLSPYTGNRGYAVRESVRGILWVTDLFCSDASGSLLAQAPSTSDLSPHDFRIAPEAALAAEQQPNAPSTRSPLVDRGLTATPITFQNGLVLQDPPFYLDASLTPGGSAYPFHAWNDDCEGHGNPRMFDHPAYTGANRTIDFGADELGHLVHAGYVDNTTSYQVLRNAAGTLRKEQNAVWSLGPHDAVINPQAAASYQSVTGNPTGIVNYPAETPWHSDVDFYDSLAEEYGFPVASLSSGTAAGAYPARFVEITPHLMPDIHPYWAGLPGGAPANFEWVDCTGAPTGFNQDLYVLPLAARIHPPGIFDGGSSSLGDFVYLDDRLLPPATPGRDFFSLYTLFLYGSTTTLQDFDAWGRGEFTAGGLTPTFHTLESTETSSGDVATLRFSLEYGENADPSTTLTPGPFGGLSAPGVPFRNIQTWTVRITPESGGGSQ